MGRLMLSVMGAFAEFERALILERQREGIAIAKRAGKYRGRKPTLNAEHTAAKAKLEAGVQHARVAREYGVSRQTLYAYVKQSA
jgi:DNA invertase Pin-like site-specific DNA recombinase